MSQSRLPLTASKAGSAAPVLEAANEERAGLESAAVARRAERTGYAVTGKRALDLLLGVPLLMAAIPLIGLCAALVVATSGWPAFYSARRLGREGREFSMWKVRSMVTGAESEVERWRTELPETAARYEAHFKLEDDPRVTRLGRLLRSTSLDELPQLWNVVRGEMSLVGPRPYYARELAAYPDARAAVVSVRPGITGPWQVSGRNAIEPPERMALDLEYAAQHSFTGDLTYLARTLVPLLRRNGT